MRAIVITGLLCAALAQETPPTGTPAETPPPPRESTTQRARRVLTFEVPPAVKADGVHWVPDWLRAIDEARRRNAPIVAVLADDKAGFFSVWNNVYSKPEFAAFSRKCVLVAALDGDKHFSKPRVVGGKQIQWCDLFDCPCDEHRATYPFVKNTFAMREYWNPLQVFCSPSGVEIGRTEGQNTTQEKLDDELARAKKTLGPSLDYDEYRDVMSKLRALVDAREKKGSAAGHAEMTKMLVADARASKDGGKRTLKSDGMRDFVEGIAIALVDEGYGLVEDAALQAERGDIEGARKMLAQVQKGFRGLAPAADAEKALAKLGGAEPSKKQ